MEKLSSLKNKKTNCSPCDKPRSKRRKEIILLPLQISHILDLPVHDPCLVIHATQPFFHGGKNIICVNSEEWKEEDTLNHTMTINSTAL